MNVLLLYFVILKAVITSFNGPSSLPILRDDLVVHRHVLTDRELNAAVVAGRSAPGPMGIYVVSVGYFIAGIPGAIAAWLALITPAVLAIPLVRYVGHRAESPRIRGTLNAIVISSAGLILASAKPLAIDAVTGPLTFCILAGSAILLSVTKMETVWVIGGAGILAWLIRVFQ